MDSRKWRGVDELLGDARRRIERIDPRTAWEASCAGGVLIVDIRSDDERRREGVVPGSLHVPRTVLEWRVDGTSGWSNPNLTRAGRRLVLLCAHGCSSSLAAATLVELGHAGAGDVIGGFQAWLEDGLPTRTAPVRPAGVLPGMGTVD